MQAHHTPSTFWLTEYNTPYDAYCHGIIEVLYQKKTKFQEMLIVRSGAYGKALILDGCWQSSTADEFIYHEALVHPACVLSGAPQRVLILGGGEGAALREVLKWKTVQRAVMVDLDGEVVDACRKYLPEMHQGAFDDPRSEIIIQDADRFLDQNDRFWDVIISDLTDPLEKGPSRALFSREFFDKCRRALAPGGCFVLQAGLTGPPEMDIHVRLAKTVEAVFDQMIHFTAHIPTWGSPMGFVLGAGHGVLIEDITPGKVDHLLETQTDGDFRMFDGRTFRSLLHPPKYLRDAISREKCTFSLGDPPSCNTVNTRKVSHAGTRVRDKRDT